MVRIVVIDNGGQWTHREWRMLRDLGVDTEIKPNTTPLDELDVDGLILSGGAPRVGLDDTLGVCDTYLDQASFPILGICAGHQFMARHFGGDADAAGTPEFGRTELILNEGVEQDDLLAGLPEKSTVWESHNDEVTVVPEGFEVLAHSKDCEVQAMRHTERPLYGLQFHPEVSDTEFGERIFQNFIDLCK
ncbi:MAG: GMP synthase subunit A [Candidatus Thermoplasmatota archaeon]|nr:GMP synthase subunit A [Candidatus Thermoplasmatota archaeon]